MRKIIISPKGRLFALTLFFSIALGVGCVTITEDPNRRTTNEDEVKDRVSEPKDQRTKEPKAEDSTLTSNINELIQKLGSDDWQTREKAQKQLENWRSEAESRQTAGSAGELDNLVQQIIIRYPKKQ